EIDAVSVAPAEKNRSLQTANVLQVNQLELLDNPNSIVTTGGALAGPFIRDIAIVKKGMSTGATPEFVRRFWEVPVLDDGGWARLQSAPDGRSYWSGCSNAILWEGE